MYVRSNQGARYYEDPSRLRNGKLSQLLRREQTM
jgi:hypothetical protein